MAPPRLWLRRLGWMAVLWTASVLALGILSLGLRLVMKTAGLSS